MKGGRLRLAMPKPLIAPMAAPTATVRTTASGIGTPAFSRSAATTEVRPTTAPTERSIPAVMMTKVCPMAMIA